MGPEPFVLGQTKITAILAALKQGEVHALPPYEETWYAELADAIIQLALERAEYKVALRTLWRSANASYGENAWFSWEDSAKALMEDITQACGVVNGHAGE